MEDNINVGVQISDGSNLNSKFLSSHFSHVSKHLNCQYYDEKDCYKKFKMSSQNSFTILSINSQSTLFAPTTFCSAFHSVSSSWSVLSLKQIENRIENREVIFSRTFLSQLFVVTRGYIAKNSETDIN